MCGRPTNEVTPDETILEPPYIEDPGEPPAFTEFMQAYPKKDNRDGALKEWWRIRPTLQLQATIMRAVRLLKPSEQWTSGFAPAAKNFLRDRRWKDADGMPDPKEAPKLKLVSSVDGTSSAPLKPAENLFTSTPQSAREALREGLIKGWQENHPGEEPPAGLLKDPIGYTTSAIKRIP